MTDHDRLFKELLSTFSIEFLELFLPDLACAIEPDSIPGSKLRAKTSAITECIPAEG